MCSFLRSSALSHLYLPSTVFTSLSYLPPLPPSPCSSSHTLPPFSSFSFTSSVSFLFPHLRFPLFFISFSSLPSSLPCSLFPLPHTFPPSFWQPFSVATVSFSLFLLFFLFLFTSSTPSISMCRVSRGQEGMSTSYDLLYQAGDIEHFPSTVHARAARMDDNHSHLRTLGHGKCGKRFTSQLRGNGF